MPRGLTRGPRFAVSRSSVRVGQRPDEVGLGLVLPAVAERGATCRAAAATTAAARGGPGAPPRCIDAVLDFIRKGDARAEREADVIAKRAVGRMPATRNE